ncbi:MAG: hypothetical protein FJW30_24725 [Acidobacteria bacterium]|nr:hypothetical protein [Acidobacteriota bacterium]
MARIGTQAVSKAAGILRAPAGLPAGLAALAQSGGIQIPPMDATQILARAVPAELVEKTAGTKYPAYHIYCEKLQNTLREKFRQFSGTALMAVDVRVTHDRLEGLDEKVQVYVDALTDVLDSNRGDWGQGMFYTGGYTVTFQPVKHGGKNFLQTAKVNFEVQVSV